MVHHVTQNIELKIQSFFYIITAGNSAINDRVNITFMHHSTACLAMTTSTDNLSVQWFVHTNSPAGNCERTTLLNIHAINFKCS